MAREATFTHKPPIALGLCARGSSRWCGGGCLVVRLVLGDVAEDLVLIHLDEDLVGCGLVGTLGLRGLLKGLLLLLGVFVAVELRLVRGACVALLGEAM